MNIDQGKEVREAAVPVVAGRAVFDEDSQLMRACIDAVFFGEEDWKKRLGDYQDALDAEDSAKKPTA